MQIDIGYNDLNRLKVVKKSEYKLVFKRDALGSLLTALYYLLITIVWMVMVSKWTESDKWIKLIFYLAPWFVMGRRIVTNFRAVFFGETYTFNKAKSIIKKNGRWWLKFSEIEGIQIREYYDSDDESLSYRLSLLGTGKRKFYIDESNDKRYLEFIAEDMGLSMDVPVIEKH